MKKVKLLLARTSITEEIYEVEISDECAKSIDAVKDDKQEVANLVDDAYQRAMRLGEVATHKINDVSDKVTFMKLKFVGVKE